MGKLSGIEWTTHTFNPWVGCTKISRACDFCYAEAWSKRAGEPELWQGERRRTSATNWRQPYKWNNAAPLSGERQRVFCASLADVFDNQAEPQWRADLWAMIRETPNLDWLLLTKRPQNIHKMLPADWGDGWSNVWLGTTAEDDAEYVKRWHWLARVPAAVRFISYEPALGPLMSLHLADLPIPDWLIFGGESGPRARPMELGWARDIRDICAENGVAFFFKQMGGVRKPFPPIPDDLMIRQFPKKDRP